METKKIQVFTNTEKIITKEIELIYPTQNKFYKMNDDSNFFGRGEVLFAIIVKYTSTFILIEVERGKQDYTDFVPTNDCKSEYWLKDSNRLRRFALDIMLEKSEDYVEISKEEFLEKRQDLLNKPLEN